MEGETEMTDKLRRRVDLIKLYTSYKVARRISIIINDCAKPDS